MWGSLVEMVRKMEPFWSLDFWNDSMLRPGCNVHYIVLLTPRSQWDSEAKTRAGWCTDTPDSEEKRGGFVQQPSTKTHFWWQKKTPAIWATLECVMKFWVLPTPVASQQALCGSVSTWSYNKLPTLRQLQSSQRAWSLNGESSQKKNLRHEQNPRWGWETLEKPNLVFFRARRYGKKILSCEESPVMVHFA